MYLPSFAMSRGTSFETSMFLISCTGIASFTSRMIFAFMGHSSTLDDVSIAVAGLVMCLFRFFLFQFYDCA